MKSRNGIIAAQDGKTIDSLPLAYDSSYGHLKIDTRDGVGHIGIYEGKCGKLVLNTSNTFKEEIFASYKHNLPFVPRVNCYMLIRDAPAFMASVIGRFAGGHIFYGGVPMSESVFVRITKERIEFVHRSGTIDATAYNSQLQDMVIRAKFMIFSNEVAGEPYQLEFPQI